MISSSKSRWLTEKAQQTTWCCYTCTMVSPYTLVEVISSQEATPTPSKAISFPSARRLVPAYYTSTMVISQTPGADPTRRVPNGRSHGSMMPSTNLGSRSTVRSSSATVDWRVAWPSFLVTKMGGRQTIRGRTINIRLMPTPIPQARYTSSPPLRSPPLHFSLPPPNNYAKIKPPNPLNSLINVNILQLRILQTI